MPLITLVSSDGKSYQVETSVFKQSEVISSLIEDLNLDIIPDAAAFPIPIRDVTGEVLEKVIEWCTHHKDDPVEMEKEEDSDCVLYPLSPWDEAFFEALRASTTIATMDTIEAASSLELICFIEHAQKFIANRMMRKHLERMKQTMK